jgi:hypothetical protein
MSQFSEVEWLLPFDLSWYSRKFLGVQDVKTGLLTSLSQWFEAPWLHFASWICLVTWNIQVAFCKIIRQFDSGPPMLEEPQSPALPIVVFQVLRELPHLAMHCLDLAPVRVSPPPDGPRFCPLQEQGQVAQPVVFAPPLLQFLLRFSADFPEGVRGSRII